MEYMGGIKPPPGELILISEGVLIGLMVSFDLPDSDELLETEIEC